MLDELYNEKIIELAGNIHRLGNLEVFDATSKKHSKLCGSTVSVELKVAREEGRLIVADYAQQVRACALGAASASILAHHVIGADATELKDLQQIMHSMLKEQGKPPQGRFEQYQLLEPVRDFKARHASTMLAIDAVVDCIEQLEATKDSSSDGQSSIEGGAVIA